MFELNYALILNIYCFVIMSRKFR